jgi:hypothetical protein
VSGRSIRSEGRRKR